MDIKFRSYEPVAFFYDWLSHAFSLGQIRQSKLSQIELLKSGNKVLYAGAGWGEDAIAAAKNGVNVTCIDMSKSMIERAENNFKSNNCTAEFICKNVMNHKREGYYDVITANYFLNIFTEKEMRIVFSHLIKLLKPGGKILIADFAQCQGNIAYRLFQKHYYLSANIFYWMIGLAPLHPIYDYSAYFNDLGLKFVAKKHFRLLKKGPIAYETTIGIKN